MECGNKKDKPKKAQCEISDESDKNILSYFLFQRKLLYMSREENFQLFQN